MGRVESICISQRKGQRKRPIEEAEFVAGHGIAGDAHAGDWHRQLSLLAAEDVAAVKAAHLPDLAEGDFAENVVLSGIPWDDLGLGSRLALGGEAVVAVTQIGKVCHHHCRIYHLTGDCIMPRRGLFARIERGGRVRAGDAAEVVRHVSRRLYQVVVLTISDRSFRGEREDASGPALRQAVEARLPAHVYAVEVLPDEAPQIAERLKHYGDGHGIDLVLTTGGTGFSPRDVTPEATRSVVERLTPGLDERMRAASLMKTPTAALSRAVSGIRGRTLVVNLPGSPRAAVENFEAIADVLPHALTTLRGETADCGHPAPPPAAAERLLPLGPLPAASTPPVPAASARPAPRPPR